MLANCLLCLLSLLWMPAGEDLERGPAPAPQPLLLVVAAPTYHAPLAPWMRHREAQGYRVEIIDPVPLLDLSQGQGPVELLRQEIARRVPAVDGQANFTADPSGPGAFVLLVGDAPSPGEELD